MIKHYTEALEAVTYVESMRGSGHYMATALRELVADYDAMAVADHTRGEGGAGGPPPTHPQNAL